MSAPCVVLVQAGAFWTASGLGKVFGDPATAVFRNALAPYTVRDVVGAPSRATTLRLSRAALRQLLADLDPGSADRDTPVFRFATASAPPRAQLLHGLLLRELAHPRGVDALAFEEAVLKLAAGLVISAYVQHARAPDRVPVTPRAREHVMAVQEFLVRHYRLNVRLGDAAAAAGCSPYHLSRIFRAVVGTTLGGYLASLRLNAGLERVLGSRDDLTTIALDCGFCDHSHFTAAFRRRYGLTPGMARRAAPCRLAGPDSRSPPGRRER